MKMRRMFAALLVAALLLSVLPVVGFGITTNDVDTKNTTTGPYNNNELYLGKTATLEDDGTYTIRLEAFATGNPVTTQMRSGLPLDIVLVLDQSGSMFNSNYLETLRESVDEFIDVIAANGRSIGVTHRVAIVGFASDIDDGSSENADNTQHQLAGGSNEVYVNTGVFLKDGTFKNYGDQTTSYADYDGDLDPNGTYYIYDYDNERYRQLTSTVSYAEVANPSTDRDDLYALVGGEYYEAMYANGYYKVTTLDPNKTYYVDVDGTKMPIKATSATTTDYTKINNLSNANGATYLISADQQSYFEITCTRSGSFLSPTYTWKDSKGNVYTIEGDENWGTYYNGYFTLNGTTYYAYEKTETTTYTWSLNGTVIDTSNTTVYDLLTGWVYEDDDGVYRSYTGTLYEVSGITWTANNVTYDPKAVPVYVRTTTGGLTNEDYRDALMPVTDGAAGAGEVTAALNTAVSKIASSGATRTSLGMTLAKNVLDNRTGLGDDDKRQTVVVVFTDGNPGFSGFENSEANAAMEISAQLKSEGKGGHAATVYTIGLYAAVPAESETSVFMHGLSSNYPTATKMTDVATVSYSSQTIDFSKEGLTTTPKVFDNYWYRVSGYGGSTNYPLRGSTNDDGTRLTLEYLSSDGTWKKMSGANNTDDFTHNVYVRSCTAYDSTGKHYLYAADKEALYDIFPEIVTDSTTTTLDQKYLSDKTILRDILQKGFVFTNGTTVTMSTLSGTWGTDKKITWGDTETVIESVTVTDADATSTTSDGGNITLHNQGGVLSVEATGFNYNTNYFSQGGHENGAKLIVTITRVEATDKVAWNQTELTNDPYSGVWSPNPDDNNKLVQIGVFPQPNTIFTNTVVVMDYAKTTEDLKELIRQSGVKHLDTDGMNYFPDAAVSIKDGYGNANITDGKLTYTPNTMKWDGYDSFYVFGNTTDSEILRHSANKVHENVWSKVTVVPANNVYYEDTFIEVGTDGKKPDWSDVVVGIEFSGDWSTAEPGDNTETPENGENDEGDNQGGVHGWEDSLADDTIVGENGPGYSDGTAAVGGANATATFTFTGTGVDIYSRTNMQTGLIMASLYAGEKAEGLPLRTLIIDNFAHSGNYYMIPTLSIHKMVKRVNGVTQTDNGNILYENMPHGTYTVKLTVIAVTDDADMDGAETTRSTYYLDGIRVYNPVEIDDTVAGAYGDGEINAVFTEVRDILLDAGNFDDSGEAPVFIDQIVNKNEDGTVTEGDVPGTTTDIGVYEAIGPENEVYLAAKQGDRIQMIAFAPGAADKHYYVGLKSPTGDDVTVQIYKNGYAEYITINHTTDMYYEVTPESGIVVISNMSENGSLLAITKIKVAGPETATFAMFRAVSREEVLTAADEAYAAAAEPETPDVEIENPEVEAPEVEEPAPETEPNLPELLSKLVKRIFGNLWDWFH